MYRSNHLVANLSVNRTACKLRLQVPSALRAPAADYLKRYPLTMRYHLFLALLPALLTGQTHAESLCKPKEVLYYSCKIAGSQKLVSLCGNALNDQNGFWLQYRFGKPEQLELVYPESRGKAKPLFVYSGFDVTHLRRSGGWDSEVSFTTHGWSYTIISWMAGEGEIARTEGVFVARNRSGPGATLKCASMPNFGKDDAFPSFVQQYDSDR